MFWNRFPLEISQINCGFVALFFCNQILSIWEMSGVETIEKFRLHQGFFPLKYRIIWFTVMHQIGLQEMIDIVRNLAGLTWETAWQYSVVLSQKTSVLKKLSIHGTGHWLEECLNKYLKIQDLKIRNKMFHWGNWMWL